MIYILDNGESHSPAFHFVQLNDRELGLFSEPDRFFPHIYKLVGIVEPIDWRDHEAIEDLFSLIGIWLWTDRGPLTQAQAEYFAERVTRMGERWYANRLSDLLQRIQSRVRP